MVRPFSVRPFSSVLCATIVTLILVPCAPAFAAETNISRGDFIRNAVKALKIPLDDDVEEPTERLPKALIPYIGAAHKRGALKIFGSAIDHAQVVTRGEAIWVLMELQSLGGSTAVRAGTFSDVPSSSPYAKAVQMAIDRQWMKPYRPKIFGIARPLAARESTLLLKRVQKAPAQRTNEETGTSTIRVQLKTKERPLPKDSILTAIWSILNEQYLYQSKINPDDAAYKAAEGLVQSLNDPYTVFMRPSSNKNFMSRIEGEVSGIGAQVEQKNGVLIIVSPLKGSPAEKAGLLPGDEILKANGESLQGLSFEDAVNKVRGPKGSSVKLTIRRNGGEMEISVVRDTVKVPEIEISFQGDIGVVKLHQFGQITERDLRLHMADIQKKNPKGIVLDLRNNPGGLLHAADVVVSNFLPEGSVVAQITSPDKNSNEVTTDMPTILASVPVVVLVNKGSASASEIVAGALQDAKRATIVGEKTFGKGTVQQVLQFTDGSSLKMTVAEWMTPSGRKIDQVGIEPDFVVPEGDRDEPMLKALELLR